MKDAMTTSLCNLFAIVTVLAGTASPAPSQTSGPSAAETNTSGPSFASPRFLAETTTLFRAETTVPELKGLDIGECVIENISRYIEMGDPPMEAALKGAEQIGFTILSLTVSLIAVLIPLLFMGDVVGRLFREFAVTLAVTIIVSAVVSLTLTP